MIQNTENYQIQTPDVEGNYLYKDDGENRIFVSQAKVPYGKPLWIECTEAEKLAWEEAHKPEEPKEEEVV